MQEWLSVSLLSCPPCSLSPKALASPKQKETSLTACPIPAKTEPATDKLDREPKKDGGQPQGNLGKRQIETLKGR